MASDLRGKSVPLRSSVLLSLTNQDNGLPKTLPPWAWWSFCRSKIKLFHEVRPQLGDTTLVCRARLVFVVFVARIVIVSVVSRLVFRVVVARLAPMARLGGQPVG